MKKNLPEIEQVYDAIGSDILRLKLDGHSFGEIFKSAQAEYPHLNLESFRTIYMNMLKQMIGQSTQLSIDVINTHISRYEKIYQFFTAMRVHNHARKALEAKEKLLGYHSDVYQFEVNNILNDKEEEAKFDIKKMTEKQTKRFIELINKARNDEQNK